MGKQDTDSVDTVQLQDAARRLESFLAGKGINLKHALALEALSTSLGAANWRTLRAKLNAPAQAAAQVTGSEAVTLGPDEPRWMVCAVYRDNSQRYSGKYAGATALEAQLACQIERLTSESQAVEVSAVIDRLTSEIADCESYVDETRLMPFRVVLRDLVKLAPSRLGPPPTGIEACDEYDRNMRALEFWAAVLKFAGENEHFRYELNELYETLPEPEDDEPTRFTDSRGVEDTIDVVDAFKRLIRVAGRRLDCDNPGDEPKKSGAFQVLQAKLTLQYCAERLPDFFKGYNFEA